MADIDTGLGWSAHSEYLMQSGDSPIINAGGLQGGTAFPGQPLPKNLSSAADVIAHGFYYGTIQNANGIVDTVYVASASDATIYACETGDPVMATFYSDTDDSIVIWVRVREPGGNITRQELKCTTAFSVTGGRVYRFTQQKYYASWNPSINVPHFTSDTDALSNLMYVVETINKKNDGYAVACVAKWKTLSGTVKTSPILISTNSEYIQFEAQYSTYSEQETNHLREGMWFNMRLLANFDSNIATSYVPVVDLSGLDYGFDTDRLFREIASLTWANIRIITSPDPYESESDPSGEEGGNGEDVEDDPVEEETLPLPSVAGHGFCTIYVPSSQELGAMASYLWSGSFDVSQVLKLFSNPMDSILGLSAVPVSLSGSPEPIYLGGVALTGITMPKYTGRTSVKVDFGTVTVKERWGSYLDYAPYTDFSIYLPFIGIKPIKADDIMGKAISLMYAIDILSGGCVAYLRPAGGSVLYEWSGQCAVQIPVTGRSYDNVFQSAMSVATATLAAVAAPASAPVLSGAVASAAVQAAASKPHIERSGTVNGITGFLGQLRPYLIRTIPEAYIPADQNKFIGYPAYINVNLADVVGYNEVDSIHLENVTATGAELDEIESILKGGVIF